jgi:hypothetical protein
VVEEVARGRLSVADVGERPSDDHPIQAGQDTSDLLGMPFDEVNHGQLGVGGRMIGSAPSVTPPVSESKTCLVPAMPVRYLKGAWFLDLSGLNNLSMR